MDKLLDWSGMLAFHPHSSSTSESLFYHCLTSLYNFTFFLNTGPILVKWQSDSTSCKSWGCFSPTGGPGTFTTWPHFWESIISWSVSFETIDIDSEMCCSTDSKLFFFYFFKVYYPILALFPLFFPLSIFRTLVCTLCCLVVCMSTNGWSTSRRRFVCL